MLSVLLSYFSIYVGFVLRKTFMTSFSFFLEQLKGVAVNENCEIVHEAAVHFDSDLPEFR